MSFERRCRRLGGASVDMKHSFENYDVASENVFFLQLHDISHDPTPFLALGNKNCFRERIELVQFLAHGLENRLLSFTYKRFKRLNAKYKSRRYVLTFVTLS
jgi:hypothetical protein